MKDIESYYKQTKNIEYLKTKFGKELWIQVAGEKDLNGASAGFWAALVDLKDLNKVYESSSWDALIGTQAPEFVVEGRNNIKYERISLIGSTCEHIVNYREFYGIKKDYVEIVEEFRLLNNLYHDRKTNIFYAIKDTGECDEVAKIEQDKNVFIKLKYLVKYATARQMALLLFFDITANLKGMSYTDSLDAFSDKFIGEDLVYSIWGNQQNGCSVLMGKKIIMPKPIEECGYWPYQQEYEYLDFIIGNDEYGEPKMFTSNPDKLANYFGANPDAPHYLTPVFFKKDVLQKYIANPEMYSIEDGYLRCGRLWGLRMDNHHKEYVSVYLGDLGRDLPREEQSHWKNYNILSDEKISNVKFKRDIMGCFADAEISDLKFKAEFSKFQKNWSDKFGWDFFLPLTDDDRYNFEQIRIPVINTQTEFDQLVLCLVKTIIDSINEKEIVKNLNDKNKDDGTPLTGSIAKLERWFEELNLPKHKEQIEFLRDLQALRSSGTGHRKGNNYEKISKKFGLDEKSFIDVFDHILQQANSFLEFLTRNFIE